MNQNAPLEVQVKKYCQRCQQERPAKDVKLVATPGGKRWSCTACLNKQSVGIYASKAKQKTK